MPGNLEVFSFALLSVLVGTVLLWLIASWLQTRAKKRANKSSERAKPDDQEHDKINDDGKPNSDENNNS